LTVPKENNNLPSYGLHLEDWTTLTALEAKTWKVHFEVAHQIQQHQCAEKRAPKAL